MTISFALPAPGPNYDIQNEAQTRSQIARALNTLGAASALTSATVANLPVAPTLYQRLFVTDANSTTFLATVAGGGSNIVPVFWNGTAWKIG